MDMHLGLRVGKYFVPSGVENKVKMKKRVFGG